MQNIPQGAPSPAMDRMEALEQWLDGQAAARGWAEYQIAPATADASFRRYFRISITPATNTQCDDPATMIVMDAPPPQENCRPFVRIAEMMRDADMCVPTVHAQDLDQGFLLLTDMGRQTLLEVVNEDNADAYFRAATDQLIKWQLASKPEVLPAYDEAVLRREISLFPEWYVARHMQTELAPSQRQTMETMFDTVLRANLAAPTVYVHRDFMPRNLMASAAPTDAPGVLDFQDALYGPISYDIAALWRDAFLSWDEERVLDGTIRYWEKAKRAGLPVPHDFGAFYRDVEWMGLQRHLKILGIFARINYRDGKPRYLADTPRFVNYVRHTANRYVELVPLLRLFDQLKIGETSRVAVTF